MHGIRVNEITNGARPILTVATAIIGLMATAPDADAFPLNKPVLVTDVRGAIAKEGGEAIAASINAARPGASDADKIIAEREIEESIAALHDTLRRLRAGRGPDVTSGEGA